MITTLLLKLPYGESDKCSFFLQRLNLMGKVGLKILRALKRQRLDRFQFTGSSLRAILNDKTKAPQWVITVIFKIGHII